MELKLRFSNSPDSNFTNLLVDELNLETIYNQIGKLHGLNKTEYVLSSKNGIKLTSKSIINNGDILQININVLGGKGGFGSLLRSFGKQITKSTNKDACRDLTGRRMRNVKNEKKLKEYLENQSEIVKKKEEEKKARLERRKKRKEKLESTHHLFVDPKYDEQKQKIADDLDQAIAIANKNKKLKIKNNSENSSSDNESSSKKDEDGSSSSESTKKYEQAQSSGSSKKEEKQDKTVENNKNDAKKPNEAKFKGWLGIDDLDVSSSDDDQEPANKKNKTK